MAQDAVSFEVSFQQMKHKSKMPAQYNMISNISYCCNIILRFSLSDETHNSIFLVDKLNESDWRVP